MKRQLYILGMYALGFSFFTTSCNDFLNVKPKGVIIPSQTEEYSKMLATDLIVRVTDDAAILMTDHAFLYAIDNSGVDLWYASYNYMDKVSQALYSFKEQVFREGDTEYTLNYGGYRSIYIYNVVIDQVMDSHGGTQREKEVILGEALVGRAFSFLELANIYSRAYDEASAERAFGMPLELKPTDGGDDLLRGRTRPSLKTYFTQIEKDLTDAIKLLNPSPRVSQYRASIPAAYGLLARMYLYMGNFPKALEYSKLCLESNSNLLDLNDYEIINDGSWSYRINVPYGVDSKESIYLRYPLNDRGPSIYEAIYPSDELIDLYDKNNDRRWQLYYTYNRGEVPTERPVWFPDLSQNIGIGTPEMYLIAAESSARTESNMTNALFYLNELRKHRYQTYTKFNGSTEEEVLREILDERRREFPFCGLARLYDLKRLNKEPHFAKTIVHKVENKDNAGNVVSIDEYSLEPNSYKYALPIPPDILKFNPEMKERDMD